MFSALQFLALTNCKLFNMMSSNTAALNPLLCLLGMYGGAAGTVVGIIVVLVGAGKNAAE